MITYTYAPQLFAQSATFRLFLFHVFASSFFASAFFLVFAMSAITYDCMHCQSSVVTCSFLDRVECLKAQGWSKQKRGGGWRCGRCTQQVQTVVELPPSCQIAGTHGIVVQPIDLPLVVEERLTHLEAKVIYFWGGLPNPGGGFPVQKRR